MKSTLYVVILTLSLERAKDERKGSLGRKCSFFSLQKSWVFFFFLRAKTLGKSLKGPQKILF